MQKNLRRRLFKQRWKPPIQSTMIKPAVRGQGRGFYRSRSHGKGRGKNIEQRQFNQDQRNYISNVQCHHCRRYGHIKADCWYKDKVVNVAEINAQSNFFMANNGTKKDIDQAWLIDSGYSNHMIGKREFFKELDESKRQKVKLGEDKEM